MGIFVEIPGDGYMARDGLPPLMRQPAQHERDREERTMKNYKVVGIRADGTRIVRNAPNVKVANRYRNWMLTNANSD